MQRKFRSFFGWMVLAVASATPSKAALIYDFKFFGVVARYSCSPSQPSYPICPLFEGYNYFSAEIVGPGYIFGPILNIYEKDGIIVSSWSPPYESMKLNFDFTKMVIGNLAVGTYDLYGSGLLNYSYGRSSWYLYNGYIEGGRLVVSDAPVGSPFAESATFGLKIGPPVPEPSTWLMLITGFVAIGTGMRRENCARRTLPI
jgi:hypothetical protein